MIQKRIDDTGMKHRLLNATTITASIPKKRGQGHLHQRQPIILLRLVVYIPFIMKENNGRAARRRLQRQLCIIIAVFALLIVVLTILGVGNDGRVVPVTRENLEQIRRQSAEFIRNRKHGGPLSKANQQQRHRLDPNSGAEEFDEVVDEAEIMERILTARYNLVDLHIVESEVRSAPSHTYAGVYGTFCELDFAQHKRDPSSGTFFVLARSAIFLVFVAPARVGMRVFLSPRF
jgi:hypothetical protein